MVVVVVVWLLKVKWEDKERVEIVVEVVALVLLVK